MAADHVLSEKWMWVVIKIMKSAKEEQMTNSYESYGEKNEKNGILPRRYT